MATVDPLEVLKRLDEESDWNDSGEEGESGSDDDYEDGPNEIDYLEMAQVTNSSFY